MESVEQSEINPATIAFARIVADCLNRDWLLEPLVLPRGLNAARAVPELEEAVD